MSVCDGNSRVSRREYPPVIMAVKRNIVGENNAWSCVHYTPVTHT